MRADGDGLVQNACGIHTLHFPQLRRDARRRAVELTSYSSKHG